MSLFRETGIPCIQPPCALVSSSTKWDYRAYSMMCNKDSVKFSSVTQLCLSLCDPIDCCTPGLLVHHQLPEFTKTCPLSQWCHPTISSYVVPSSSHLQSFSASGSFPMSQVFASGGQSIGVSASVSVLLKNIQDWFPLGWTGWISLLSKGLLWVFSNTTVQKHLIGINIHKSLEQC